jgi:sporulation protein YlmC with PRC-barrel domain
MQYVSELLGAAVRDPAGQVVGKVADLLVPADADYPAIEAVALKPARGGQPRTVPWSAVRILDDGRLGLGSPIDEVPAFESPSHELSLARQVLDHQIIDINGVRVVRVNDLQLARSDGSYRLVGVDVSTAGLLRRLGAARVLDLLGVEHSDLFRRWTGPQRDERT